MSPQPEQLLQRWQRLVQPYLGSNQSAEYGWLLLQQYQQPHRHYHTLHHLSQLLQWADTLAQQLAHPHRFCLAAWYHDAIYNPQSATNEADSAALFVQHFAHSPLSAADRQAVEAIVLATARHQVAGNDPDLPLFLDADLAILGSPAQHYQHYSQQIRAEYQHLPSETYRLGRLRVLQHFLQQPRIYHSAYFGQLFEAQARRNLQTESQQLSQIQG